MKIIIKEQVHIPTKKERHPSPYSPRKARTKIELNMKVIYDHLAEKLREDGDYMSRLPFLNREMLIYFRYDYEEAIEKMAQNFNFKAFHEHELGDLLGCGAYGIAFSLNDLPGYVLKLTYTREVNRKVKNIANTKTTFADYESPSHKIILNHNVNILSVEEQAEYSVIIMEEVEHNFVENEILQAIRSLRFGRISIARQEQECRDFCDELKDDGFFARFNDLLVNKIDNLYVKYNNKKIPDEDKKEIIKILNKIKVDPLWLSKQLSDLNAIKRYGLDAHSGNYGRRTNQDRLVGFDTDLAESVKRRPSTKGATEADEPEILTGKSKFELNMKRLYSSINQARMKDGEKFRWSNIMSSLNNLTSCSSYRENIESLMVEFDSVLDSFRQHDLNKFLGYGKYGIVFSLSDLPGYVLKLSLSRSVPLSFKRISKLKTSFDEWDKYSDDKAKNSSANILTVEDNGYYCIVILEEVEVDTMLNNIIVYLAEHYNIKGIPKDKRFECCENISYDLNFPASYDLMVNTILRDIMTQKHTFGLDSNSNIAEHSRYIDLTRKYLDKIKDDHIWFYKKIEEYLQLSASSSDAHAGNFGLRMNQDKLIGFDVDT